MKLTDKKKTTQKNPDLVIINFNSLHKKIIKNTKREKKEMLSTAMSTHLSYISEVSSGSLRVKIQMTPGSALFLYPYIMCVPRMWQESTHTHGRTEDSMKSVETYELQRAVLQWEKSPSTTGRNKGRVRPIGLELPSIPNDTHLFLFDREYCFSLRLFFFKCTEKHYRLTVLI